MDKWWTDEYLSKKPKQIGQKPVPVSFHPPRIPHEVILKIVWAEIVVTESETDRAKSARVSQPVPAPMD
jgi:hypothetical protein